MTDHAPKPMDIKSVLTAARDILVSAGIGWAGAQAAIAFFQARTAETTEDFEAFLSFLGPIVWVTLAGLTYAIIIHFHTRRDARNRECSPSDARNLGDQME